MYFLSGGGYNSGKIETINNNEAETHQLDGMTLLGWDIPCLLIFRTSSIIAASPAQP